MIMHLQEKGNTQLRKCSFKALINLRKTTSDELIKELIGHDAEKLCLEIIRRADKDGPKKNSLYTATTRPPPLPGDFIVPECQR